MLLLLLLPDLLLLLLHSLRVRASCVSVRVRGCTGKNGKYSQRRGDDAAARVRNPIKYVHIQWAAGCWLLFSAHAEALFGLVSQRRRRWRLVAVDRPNSPYMYLSVHPKTALSRCRMRNRATNAMEKTRTLTQSHRQRRVQ